MAIPVATAILAGSALGSAGSIGGSLISNSGSRKSQKRANKYNVEMYNRQRADAVADRDLSRQWSLDDWNMENEYNSPASQMMRYKDAGLNPNLIYGEGVAASSGQASEPRATETRSSQQGNAQAARYNMDFGMQQFAQNMLMHSQAKKLDAETDSIRATTEKTGVETDTLRTMLPINKETGEVNIQQARANIDKIGTEILNNTKDLDLKAQQLIESNARIKKMYNDTVLARLELENAINRTDIDRYDASTRRMDAFTRKGELGVHQKDFRLRKNQNALSWYQFNFEKQKASLDAEFRKMGLTHDASGGLWKTVGTVYRTLFNAELSNPSDINIPNF